MGKNIFYINRGLECKSPDLTLKAGKVAHRSVIPASLQKIEVEMGEFSEGRRPTRLA